MWSCLAAEHEQKHVSLSKPGWSMRHKLCRHAVISRPQMEHAGHADAAIEPPVP